ncbi:MAG: HAD family hydrolase [Micrococcales bacterium]
MTSSLQAVLFDMDGTLIDSEHYWMEAENDLAKISGASWTEQDGLNLVGMSLYDSSEILKEKLRLSLDNDEIISRLTDTVVKRLGNTIPWRPGALELLTNLRERGIKTALVTMSMRRNALAVSQNVGFDAFDVVIAGDDVTHGKPHPEPYLKAADALGVDITHCVAFEDSLTGLTSAERSGAVAIGVPNVVEIPAKPDRIIWPTLVGITPEDLIRLVTEKRTA